MPLEDNVGQPSVDDFSRNLTKRERACTQQQIGAGMYVYLPFILQNSDRLVSDTRGSVEDVDLLCTM